MVVVNPADLRMATIQALRKLQAVMLAQERPGAKMTNKLEDSASDVRQAALLIFFVDYSRIGYGQTRYTTRRTSKERYRQRQSEKDRTPEMFAGGGVLRLHCHFEQE